MKRTTTPKQMSDAFLEPIVKAALERRGTKKQLAAALSKRTGEHVPREQVERWLKTDPAKRQQPLLGSALLLKEEFDKLTNNNNETKR
jgi:hypothetical protein